MQGRNRYYCLCRCFGDGAHNTSDLLWWLQLSLLTQLPLPRFLLHANAGTHQKANTFHLFEGLCNEGMFVVISKGVLEDGRLCLWNPVRRRWWTEKWCWWRWCGGSIRSQHAITPSALPCSLPLPPRRASTNKPSPTCKYRRKTPRLRVKTASGCFPWSVF